MPKDATRNPRAVSADQLVGRTLASDVQHRLRADIIACVLRPGERLRFDALREIYGVSFSTLREALTRLASDKLVVTEGQRGFRVAPVSQRDLMDLTDARVMVEREVMRLAVLHGDVDWEAKSIAAFHRMDRLRSAEPDRYVHNPEWAALHSAFHDALADGCPNLVLRELRLGLFDRAHRYRRLSSIANAGRRDNIGEHRAILEAAVRRDVNEACDLTERHIRKTTENVLSLAREPSSAAEGSQRLLLEPT